MLLGRDHELGLNMVTKDQDQGSGSRIRIKDRDQGSGSRIRIRIKDQDLIKGAVLPPSLMVFLYYISREEMQKATSTASTLGLIFF